MERYMPKDEREVLTKDRIKADLLQDLKAEKVGCIGWSILAMFVLGLLFAFACMVADNSVWNGITVAIWILSLAVSLLVIITWIFIIRRVLFADRILKNEDFYIVEDQLVRISEDEIPTVSRFGFAQPGTRFAGYGSRLADALYFSTYGKVFVRKQVSRYSVCGDRFYLVVYNDAKKEIIKLYSSKIYRFAEESL